MCKEPVASMSSCTARARAGRTQPEQRAGIGGQEEADGTRITATSVGPWRFGLISIMVGAQAGGKVDLHPKSKFLELRFGKTFIE